MRRYARSAFLGVDTSIRKSQYREGQTPNPKHPSPNTQAQTHKPKHTSVVVSAKDKKISVFEDHKVVATGAVKVKDHHKPLADRA
jgi:hypothetical protein